MNYQLKGESVVVQVPLQQVVPVCDVLVVVNMVTGPDPALPCL